MLLSITMIAFGLFLAAWGLPAAHSLRKPLDIIAALAFTAGVILAVIGVLTVCVPGFFKG